MNELFWRTEPLTEAENSLWEAVKEAHYKSALRNNLSSDAICASALGSGDYFKALAAALLTLGGLHGPVEQATRLLSQPLGRITDSFYHGNRIPGWGNSFCKGYPDQNWAEVEKILAARFPEWADKLEKITSFLHEQGKKIYPNPACFTAVTALILGAPPESSGFLFVRARLGAWSQIFQHNVWRI